MSPERQLEGRRALLTGASGGVGRALAVRLAQSGADSVLLARNDEGLRQTAEMVRSEGGRAEIVAGDVCLAEDRAAALDAAKRYLGGLDLLVNNAGVGAHGRFHESDPERLRKIFEVNLFAPANLTREALPLLSAGERPCVANIGSVLGWRGAPQTSEYGASKFALRGWSEAIRPEMERLGIHVLHASPSTIDTAFRENLIERRERLAWSGRRGVSPEKVADRVVRGIARRKNEVAIIWEDWALVRLSRWAPWLLDRVMKRYA